MLEPVLSHYVYSGLCVTKYSVLTLYILLFFFCSKEWNIHPTRRQKVIYALVHYCVEIRLGKYLDKLWGFQTDPDLYAVSGTLTSVGHVS